MQIKIDEIEDNIFRIARLESGGFISSNQFLMRDEKSILTLTGHKKTFELIKGEVAKLIDPAKMPHCKLPKGRSNDK